MHRLLVENDDHIITLKEIDGNKYKNSCVTSIMLTLYSSSRCLERTCRSEENPVGQRLTERLSTWLNEHNSLQSEVPDTPSSSTLDSPSPVIGLVAPDVDIYNSDLLLNWD